MSRVASGQPNGFIGCYLLLSKASSSPVRATFVISCLLLSCCFIALISPLLHAILWLWYDGDRTRLISDSQLTQFADYVNIMGNSNQVCMCMYVCYMYMYVHSPSSAHLP
jgi:hypothetical protein